jgi:hypothetical protein
MAQMQNAQSVAPQLEKVRDKLPLLYERDDILLTMIQQRGDIERVSSRNMRLPLQIRPGGKAGLANMDGGDLGRGSGTTYDVAQVTPVFFHAVEITKLVEYASNAPEKAIENAAKREVKNAMAQFRALPRQGDADQRKRRPRNDFERRHRPPRRNSIWFHRRARRSSISTRRSRFTIPRSPPTAGRWERSLVAPQW